MYLNIFSEVLCDNNLSFKIFLPSFLSSQLPHSLPGIDEGLYCGFAFDYSSGLIALCTENYGIQFYSLFDDRGMYEVRSFRLMVWLIYVESPTCQLVFSLHSFACWAMFTWVSALISVFLIHDTLFLILFVCVEYLKRKRLEFGGEENRDLFSFYMNFWLSHPLFYFFKKISIYIFYIWTELIYLVGPRYVHCCTSNMHGFTLFVGPW